MSHSLLPVDRSAVEDAHVDAIVQMTRRLFGVEPLVEEECDPDEPDTRWLVFRVPMDVPLEQTVDKQLAWYAELRQIMPQAIDEYRLSTLVGQ